MNPAATFAVAVLAGYALANAVGWRLPGHARGPAAQRPDAALLKGAEMTGLPIALTVAAILLIAWNWRYFRV